MDIEKQKTHLECSLSDTDIFIPAIVQTDILRSTYEEVYPISKLEDNGPIDFKLENNTDKFLDLSNSYIKAKLKIVNEDGSDIADTDKVTCVNYSIASIFLQTDVMMNGSIVSDSTNTYSYRAYIEAFLNYRKEAKNSFQWGFPRKKKVVSWIYSIRLEKILDLMKDLLTQTRVKQYR